MKSQACPGTAGETVPEQSDTVDGRCLVVASEAVPGQGEDSYAADADRHGGLLCVADGCGGSGARRYEKLGRQSEAYLASRMATTCVRAWVAAMDGGNLPQCAADAAMAAAMLKGSLQNRLRRFHTAYQNETATRMVMRGLQRTLPTTLCAALIDARPADVLRCVFFWAGDSRGYVLTGGGLKQCTADHVAGPNNALENLYRDARLTNLICADGDFAIEAYGLTLPKPCVVLAATDGAFGYLPTPMEFELLLLNTLLAATTFDGWQKRLCGALTRLASDDCTLTVAAFGFNTYAAMQAYFAPRRAVLQAQYVTPVRRRRQNVDFARTLWAQYRTTYELREEERHADWRL